MLDWKRFEWAAKKGTLDREPLSWEKNMNALFEATIEHFEPNNSTHRARFLELVGEGIGPD